MRRPFSSVRSRAALAATLVVAVALVAAAFALLFALRSNLTDQAEGQADQWSNEVAQQIANHVPIGELELPDSEDHPTQVTDAKGRLLIASEDMQSITGTGVSAVRPASPPPTTAPTPTPTPSPAPTGDDDDDNDDDSGGDDDSGDDDDSRPPGAPADGKVSRPTGHSEGSVTVQGTTVDHRFSQREVTGMAGGPYLVHVGASLGPQQSAVAAAQIAMIIGLPALLVVVGGVTWLVTRRALKPVEGIRREMAAITASEDLSRRVPEPGTHDEVAKLARTTNETLTALEASVERQRRFVADASHELRSPIASLRTQLEVGAAHPELLDVPGAVADTVRLQQLAADLLLLARLDAGEQAGRTRLDLAALVREEVSQRSADRIPVVPDVRSSAEVAGSRGQLARVLGNLLDNAQRHAAGEIRATVRREGGQVVLAVSDDGAGVPEEERERIFERFVRLDDARSRDDGGAGLGLAIARDVAHRHGGTLEVGRGEAGGALFELRLPAAGRDPEGPVPAGASALGAAPPQVLGDRRE
ncbi:HAMP domain-containing histidine kinase [Streptomyces sp. NBC_01725]|uniref:sensor histidine kinase n=1 Tax=Streptomyces sp. NBC_01725 TaxID=2975923 RepID=UPI002E2D6BBC|nr:HAMP domain-containing sensor histidine kinase [Streptomyces sp. NBC_01725]